MKYQLLFLVVTLSTISAQGPAQGPVSSGSVNITGILSKAGQFNTFIHLLQNTQEANQINNQLINSNQGLTMFAPTDNAFSSLPSGTLNSLTDQEKAELVQFHILPIGLSLSQFQTVSNPLRTQAGNTNDGAFPLNVTRSGNQVNITTGVVKATVSNLIYSGGQLFVYQVDQVLLPMQLFKTHAIAPALSPSSPKSPTKAADSPVKGVDTTVDSSQGSIIHHFKLSSRLLMLFAFFFMLL